MGFETAFYLTDQRLIALAMIVVLAVACEIGFRAGSRKRDAAESFRTLMSGIGAATFGLLALLLGFTLAMAIGRWDARRNVLLEESNAINTLGLRASLCEQPVRDELQALLHEYTDARIELGSSQDDLDAWRTARHKSQALQSEIWFTLERASGQGANATELSSLVSATIDLVNIRELRLASVENFLPASLLLTLLGVAAVAIYFLAWAFGAVGRGGRVAILLLGLVVAAVLVLIMDINRPQRGAFQVGVATLERVQNSIPSTTEPVSDQVKEPPPIRQEDLGR
jgi:hypothetical protein